MLSIVQMTQLHLHVYSIFCLQTTLGRDFTCPSYVAVVMTQYINMHIDVCCVHAPMQSGHVCTHQCRVVMCACQCRVVTCACTNAEWSCVHAPMQSGHVCMHQCRVVMCACTNAEWSRVHAPMQWSRVHAPMQSGHVCMHQCRVVTCACTNAEWSHVYSHLEDGHAPLSRHLCHQRSSSKHLLQRGR